MIQLIPDQSQPAWHDINIKGGGQVRLKLKPFGPMAESTAMEYVREVMLDEGEHQFDDMPADAAIFARAKQSSRWSFELQVGLAMWAIQDWDNVGDENGQPAPITPRYVRALLPMLDGFNFIGHYMFNEVLAAKKD